MEPVSTFEGPGICEVLTTAPPLPPQPRSSVGQGMCEPQVRTLALQGDSDRPAYLFTGIRPMSVGKHSMLGKLLHPWSWGLTATPHPVTTL